jgi:hypothetical protein
MAYVRVAPRWLQVSTGGIVGSGANAAARSSRLKVPLRLNRAVPSNPGPGGAGGGGSSVTRGSKVTTRSEPRYDVRCQVHPTSQSEWTSRRTSPLCTPRRSSFDPGRMPDIRYCASPFGPSTRIRRAPASSTITSALHSNGPFHARGAGGAAPGTSGAGGAASGTSGVGGEHPTPQARRQHATRPGWGGLCMVSTYSDFESSQPVQSPVARDRLGGAKAPAELAVQWSRAGRRGT